MSSHYLGTNEATAAVLAQAAQNLNLGNTAAVEQMLAPLLEIPAAKPEALRLLGLLRHRQGRLADADEHYRASLELRPAQADVLFAVGNVARQRGRLGEAIAAFRDAIKLRTHYLEAHFNLAVALQESGDLPAAERSYRTVLWLQPSFTPALQGLAGVLIDLGRPDEAKPLLRRVLAETKEPDKAAALEHALGVVHQMQGQYDVALVHNARALALKPDLAIAQAARADLLQHTGHTDEALNTYRAVIERDPLNMAAHAGLNTLLYRLGRDAEFLHSFDASALRMRNNAPLHIGKANLLMKIERFAEARDEYARALATEPNNLSAIMGLAAAHSGLKSLGEAIAIFEKGVALQPNDANLLAGFAATLLQARDAERAREVALQALGLRPYDQSALALLGIAYRVLGDDRDELLTGYDRLVGVFDLDPPDGFSSMTDFNYELAAYLDHFQTDARGHLDQTVRGGTRAATGLFGSGHMLVDRLRVRIDSVVRRYIEGLADAKDHPYHGRRTRTFGYSGSWSSRLCDRGFHLNHIHPAGWISSAYYIAVPDQSADDQAKQGWLKFGEPPWDVGLSEPVKRTIQPSPGRLVLFPSYMWHGTTPFRSEQSRSTIAFDVVPR
ncbi:MAG: tetratricopeptide repeat protein [Alphaproteobacteria bacterium]|nr:tetratricopeptide repeat protein [Alphaproteobacteria bacterium]